MNNLRIKHENDAVFREGHFPSMRSVYYPAAPEVPVQVRTTFRAAAHLERSDTISAVLRHRGAHVCALNFANANFPGGGYILGGNAQEEALCRASLLYYSIRTVHGYYRRNRLHVLPDYTDGMIWTHDVPVIRDNTGARLPEPMLCDFLTSPAVNRTVAKFLMTRRYLDRVMERRITGIIRLAAAVHPQVLILGAYGCGEFGNKRERVYPMFEQAITQYLPDDITVIFADPALSLQGGNPYGTDQNDNAPR